MLEYILKSETLLEGFLISLMSIITLSWLLIVSLIVHVKNSIEKKIDSIETHVTSDQNKHSEILESLLLLKDSFRRHVHETRTELNRISSLELEIEDIKQEIHEIKETLCGNALKKDDQNTPQKP